VVVSGPLPVDELNKCLGIDGYCGRLFARLASLPHGKFNTKPYASPFTQSTAKSTTKPFKATTAV
jgi:hypothetical protein